MPTWTHVLRWRAATGPGLVALTDDEGARLTYGELAAEVPRNATGKVLKTKLRAPYWDGHERRVS